jgi:hypothetical protein
MKKVLILAIACIAGLVLAGESKVEKAEAKKACCASMAKSESGCSEKVVAAKAEAKVKVAKTETVKATAAKKAEGCSAQAATVKAAAKTKSCCASKSEKQAKSDET